MTQRHILALRIRFVFFGCFMLDYMQIFTMMALMIFKFLIVLDEFFVFLLLVIGELLDQVVLTVSNARTDVSHRVRIACPDVRTVVDKIRLLLQVVLIGVQANEWINNLVNGRESWLLVGAMLLYICIRMHILYFASLTIFRYGFL